MTYPHLRFGDHLPAVAVMQTLLQANALEIVHRSGRYDRHTVRVIEDFQRRKGLAVNGYRLDRGTWLSLLNMPRQMVRMPIIDLVDASGGSSFHPEPEPVDIVNDLSEPIVLQSDPHGVTTAVNRILSLTNGRPIFLLRVHGHGGDADIGISSGHGADPGGGASISSANLEALRPVLTELRPLFAPYSCIQFMHCLVAHSAAGEDLLEDIADMISVPVTGAREPQLAGGITDDATFRYEGAYYNAVPAGMTLNAWGRSLPRFPNAILPADTGSTRSEAFSMAPRYHF